MLIRPCLRKLMGQEQIGPTTITAVLEEDLHKRPGLQHFVTGQVSPQEGGYRVRPIGRPEHTFFSAMSITNGFIVVPADQEHLKRGAMVTVHLLEPLPSTWIFEIVKLGLRDPCGNGCQRAVRGSHGEARIVCKGYIREGQRKRNILI